jgi:molybdopterin converting factor small subunit
MPSGGLTEDGTEWLHTHPKFFAPVREISKKFKALFLEALGAVKADLEPELPSNERDALIKALERTNWVVFSQASFTKPDHVIDYLGNYTHKIAISNYRLIKLEDDRVFFSWKDYKDSGKEKIMSLHVFEFMRRFLEHVLPYNFYKIRHYGIFGNRYKTANIENARRCLAKEDKILDHVDLDFGEMEGLPAGCIYMGACKECGRATISLYHYRLGQLHGTGEKVLLRQTG